MSRWFNDKTLCVIALCITLPWGAAYADFSHKFMSESAAVGASLTSPFDRIPQACIYPLRLEISNNTSSSARYTLHGSSGSAGFGTQLSADFVLDVPAYSVRSREFYFPVGDKSASYYTNLRLSLYGPGFSGDMVNIPNTYPESGSVLLPYMAISNECGGELEELRQNLKKSLYTFSGSSFSPSLLPANWKGLLGVRKLWISDSEWEQLSSDQTTALKDWVFQGGVLYAHLSMSQSSLVAAFVQQGAEQKLLSYGLGRVIFSERNTAKVNVEDLRLAATGKEFIDAPFLGALGEHTSSEIFGPEQGFEPFSSGMGLVVLLMMVYACLVGPVNLFIFAKGGKRFRLYWTTPLLALTATACLLVCIVYRDGTGAEGRRSQVIVINPYEKRALFLQEQAYRSGLLLSRSFGVPPEVTLFPAQDKSDGSNPAKRFLQGALEYHLADDIADGDWFGNRRIQRHQLQWYESSRGKIEVVREGPQGIEVRSTLSGELETLYLIDAQGDVWTGSKIGPGQTRTLQPALHGYETQWPEFRREAAWHLGDAGKAVLERIANSRRVFVARLREPAFMCATLPAVRWQGDVTYVMGPLPAPESGGRQL